MEKYLHIGGSKDGQFLETDGRDTMYYGSGTKQIECYKWHYLTSRTRTLNYYGLESLSMDDLVTMLINNYGGEDYGRNRQSGE